MDILEPINSHYKNMLYILHLIGTRRVLWSLLCSLYLR